MAPDTDHATSKVIAIPQVNRARNVTLNDVTDFFNFSNVIYIVIP